MVSKVCELKIVIYIFFNRDSKSIRNKDMESTLPYIDPHQKINTELLSMAGTIPMPSQEEIDSDPRLKEAFCSAIEEGEASGYVDDFDFETHLQELNSKGRNNG